MIINLQRSRLLTCAIWSPTIRLGLLGAVLVLAIEFLDGLLRVLHGRGALRDIAFPQPLEIHAEQLAWQSVDMCSWPRAIDGDVDKLFKSSQAWGIGGDIGRRGAVDQSMYTT